MPFGMCCLCLAWTLQGSLFGIRATHLIGFRKCYLKILFVFFSLSLKHYVGFVVCLDDCFLHWKRPKGNNTFAVDFVFAGKQKQQPGVPVGGWQAA